LHSSLISFYGRQILETLVYLHDHKIYHLHLHAGNILIDKNNNIHISGLENFICDLTIRNQNHYNYVIDNICIDEKNNFKNNLNLFSDIYRNQFNIFEKIDIISFGRIIYEMTFGKELNCYYPDEMEYNLIDKEITSILKTIFFEKNLKLNSNIKELKLSPPDATAKDLINLEFFKLNKNINSGSENNNIIIKSDSIYQ